MPLLIHIGYPKTASTWLQQTLFNSAEAGFESPLSVLQIKEAFFMVNEYMFSSAQTNTQFENDINAVLDRGNIPVISDEWFSGNQVTAEYQGRIMADRLHDTFPDALILIVLREQKSMILSSYREFVKTGGSFPIEEYTGQGAFREGFNPVCRLDHLKYDLMIEYFQQKFGKDRVVVMPHELLWSDPEEFYNRLCERCGARGNFRVRESAQNVGVLGAELILRRMLNALLLPPSYATPVGKNRHLTVRKVSRLVSQLVPKRIDDRIERKLRGRVEVITSDYFEKSNRKTSELCALNLSEFGYGT